MADQVPGTGRARGRARGRSRGPQTQQGPPAAAAAAAQQAAAAAAPPAVASTSAQQPSGTGRASHRGGVRPSVVDTGKVTEGMAQMGIGGSGDPHTVSSRGSTRGAMHSMDDIVRTRPDHVATKTGTSGDIVPLMANYFRVVSTPDFAIHQYHVEFNPNIEHMGMRKAMMGDHRKTVFKDLPYLFDGMALWSPVKLHEAVTEATSQRRSDGVNVTISIKFIREVAPNDPIILQICNVQMRRNFTHLKFQLLGRNYFNCHESAAIPRHGLELWPGYTTSIRQHETSVLMGIDLSFKILRTDTVLELLYQCYQKDKRNFKDLANKQLLGCIVLTRYNNRTYRIDDIQWDNNPLSTFKKRDDTDINYIDYYQQNWNIKITDKTQPLLVSAPKKRDIRRGMTQPFLLIPEFCAMTGLSDETRADYNVMKDIAVHTRVNPDKRVEKLLSFLRRIKGNPEINSEMSKWGMSYSDSLVQLRGRVLNEKVYQDNKQLMYDPKSADWSKEMRNRRLKTCVPLINWICIATQRDISKADDLVQNLINVARPMGIEYQRPKMVPLADDRTNTFVQALRQEIRSFSGLQLVCVVVPNNRKDRYDAIKKICCHEFPVASQVVVARTLMKRQMLMSVATKIAIQLNCKLGGEVWTLDIPPKGLMVVGYDSYHDSSKKGRSVGGVVCSTNATLTRYHSSVTFQEQQQEMLDGFCTSLMSGLKSYHVINKSLPTTIIIYRDGVGDGQLAMVKEWELPQIELCFSKIGPDYKPRLTFIVVTKRLNTRFFSNKNGINNPMPGTVVDTEVTRPERYDFFLVSQSVRQGTVAPTAYNVIHDTGNMQPEHIQRLTYKLTHLYYNWPGTIRVPAPCQYAHKLAFLTGQSLHQPPLPDLANTLFYL